MPETKQPGPGQSIINQPRFQPTVRSWKDKYFAKHPEADTNKDGNLTWPEYKAHRAKFDPEPAKFNNPESKK
jgi:hypothetical protein